MNAIMILCLATVTVAALGGTPKFTDQSIPGVAHRDGDTLWTESLERRASAKCADTSIRGAMDTGRPSSQPVRADAEDCVFNTVAVRNDSSRPIQCHLHLEEQSADEGGKTLQESDMVIFPGLTLEGAGSYSRSEPAPKSFGSECWILPAPPLAELKVPAECVATLKPVNIDDYYPPGSIRRGEEGNVTFEYSTVESSPLVQDVKVVASSGFPDLDNATLKLAKRLKVSGGCPGQRQRHVVGFKFRESGSRS